MLTGILFTERKYIEHLRVEVRKKRQKPSKKEAAHNGIILTEKGAKLSLLKGLIIDSLNLKLSINNATRSPPYFRGFHC